MTNWVEVLTQCGVRRATVALWAPVFSAEINDTTFSLGLSEIDDFLGQILHESGLLERIEEGLSYSADRLCVVWPSRFPSLASAAPYARNPEALANRVYGGRMGNTEPGDGYKFRGRGVLQVTGRANYEVVGKAIGIDLVEDPDQLAEPTIALRASIAWWEGHIPDGIVGNVLLETKRVNGGTTGLADRQKLTTEAQGALT